MGPTHNNQNSPGTLKTGGGGGSVKITTPANIKENHRKHVTFGFFVFNTNLTFLYKIDIEGFKR